MVGRASGSVAIGSKGGTPSSSELVREFGPSETVARSLAAADAPLKLWGDPTGKPEGRKDQADPSPRTRVTPNRFDEVIFGWFRRQDPQVPPAK